ncbi:vacuolar protein sorting-associated protein 28 homolog 2, partial [Tanacetum coccineum]
MEVKLWNDKHEREMYEKFSELYAIIKATEKLEKAYVRDIISSAGSVKNLSHISKHYLQHLKIMCRVLKVEHRVAAAASGLTSAATVAE